MLCCFFLCLLVVGCDEQEQINNPHSYRESFHWGLSIGTEPTVVREFEIPEEGSYLILYTTEIVNNERYDIGVCLMFWQNEQLIIENGENVTPGRHYAVFSLHYAGLFQTGGILKFTLYATSDCGIRPYSIVVADKGYSQGNKESLTVIRLTDAFYQTGDR